MILTFFLRLTACYLKVNILCISAFFNVNIIFICIPTSLKVNILCISAFFNVNIIFICIPTSLKVNNMYISDQLLVCINCNPTSIFKTFQDAPTLTQANVWKTMLHLNITVEHTGVILHKLTKDTYVN